MPRNICTKFHFFFFDSLGQIWSDLSASYYGEFDYYVSLERTHLRWYKDVPKTFSNRQINAFTFVSVLLANFHGYRRNILNTKTI